MGKRKRVAIDPVLTRIVEFYQQSGDFNGLPVRTLFKTAKRREAIRAKLRELIESGQVTMEFGLGHPNPHIKAFPKDGTNTKQLEELATNDLAHACAYPTPSVLEKFVSSTECQDRPFTRRLMLGEAQLDFHAFDLSVLEHYRNDPRYHYENNDISGWISIRDAFYLSNETLERDKTGLQTFGFGYDKSMNRAVVVFTRYLHDLPAEHQQIWNAKRLDGQFRLHPDYYRNSILGEWGTKISLFEAFTEELKHINAMTKLIGKPPLFRDEFRKRVRGFSFLVRPTTEEFNDFVLLLDQMMSDNLNKDFLRGDVELETETARADGKIVVTSKGTIQLLEQWFQKKMRFKDPKPFEEMVATFREVRRARQSPAHKAEDSTFDPNIFREQRELAMKAYNAVRTIRLMLANHPATRGYQIPEDLYKGEIWTF
jgi:hypothetical protein